MSMEECYVVYVKIFVLVGVYVLMFGVFGVVMGFIYVMGEMLNLDKFSEVIVVVFVCMIFGIFIGYVFWMLFVNKLKVKL